MKQRLSFRVISMLIVISMCISILPSSVLAVDDNFFAANTGENMIETEMVEAQLGIDKNSVPEIIGHEEALRRNHVGRLYDEEGDDLNKVIFLNKDGSKTMYLFDFPVKYIDENGTIKDISLQIEDAENKNGDFKTADNAAVTTFSAKLSDGIRLTGNDTSIQLVPVLNAGNQNVLSITNTSTSLVTDSNATRVNENTIEYQYDDKTTIEYSLTYTGFKEDIVVSEYTGQTTYPFYLYTNGLELKEIENSYYLVDDTDNIKASIGDIIIFTADERNNAFGDIVPTTIIESQEYLLNIVVDADYLADPNTTYPIRIDPTIEINYDSSGSAAIEDITITTNTNYNGSHTSLYVGRRSTEGIARALMRFPGLNLSGLSNITVTSAAVRVRDLMCEDTPLDVSCHVFTGNVWDANSATWSAVSPNSYVSTPLSTNTLSWSIGDTFDPIHWYYFDITSAVQGWANGIYAQNKGIIFKVASSVENGSTIANRTFGSYNRASYKPSFSMTYFDGTSSIALSTTSCSIQEGNTRTLVATTNPAGQAVTWSTSNSAVATVSSSGVVTAKKAGTATITARTVDPNGVTKTATCIVYVYIANGVYYIKNMNSNYYLNVKNGGAENFTDVCQYLKYSSSSSELNQIRQMWKVFYLGNGRYSVRPMNRLSMGLDVTGGNVDIYHIGTSDTLSDVATYARWSVDWYSTGYVFKGNGNNNSTMQISNASTGLSATVSASTYSTTLNCRWELTPVTSAPSGVYWYDTLNDKAVSTAHFADLKYVTYNNPQKSDSMGLIAISYSPTSINQSFTWTSQNTSHVTVNSTSGLMTGNNSGKTRISARKTVNGTSYTLTFDIISIGADQYNAGVRIATVNGKQYYDYTIPVNRLFASAVTECEDHRCMNWTQYCSWAYDISIFYEPNLAEHKGMQLGSFLWFLGQVNHGQVWDIKVPACWNAALPGVPFLYENNTFLDFVFRGEITTAEGLGNIMYGYTGRATGFGETTLYWGGGVAAQGSIDNDEVRNPPYYGDTVADHYNIQKGFNMFNEDYPNYPDVGHDGIPFPEWLDPIADLLFDVAV